MKNAFLLPPTPYLLSHSVGRPLRTLAQHVEAHLFAPWGQGEVEPWQAWLGEINAFNAQLSRLFNAPAHLFCPQVNLSSGLTKLAMAHPRLQNTPCRILMSEHDFPSMGFALKKALPHAQIEYIPTTKNVTEITTWQSYINEQIGLVFVSHVYSNTGQQAPVAQICALARQFDCLSLVDVAQSAGIIELDLQQVQPDFMLGSSVKWLCGGAGAAYLWVSEQQLSLCEPKDVGWFSHENPFEFNIHHFAYHKSALRFWGGTPSVAPYVMAGHSIEFINDLGVKVIRDHNLILQDKIHHALEPFVVSPKAHHQRSGTVILHFGADHQAVLSALNTAKIAVDSRAYGIRVSPHIYNNEQDINQLINNCLHLVG